MATFRDILTYYRPYWGISIFSITAASLFEMIDLAVPYAIGQILNVLSDQPLDRLMQTVITTVATASKNLDKPTHQ